MSTECTFYDVWMYYYTRHNLIDLKSVLTCDMIMFLYRMREVRILNMMPNTGISIVVFIKATQS